MLRANFIREKISWIVSLLLLAIAIGVIALLVFDYSKSFVHPTDFLDILARSVSNGLSVDWDDLKNSIAQWGPEESRPRFLAFLVEGFDTKLRLFLYNFIMLPATLWPIAWLFQIVVGPVFLFRLVRNLGGDRTASTVTVAIYLSSIGFLSGIAMAFIPGKALVTVSLIIAMYSLSSIRQAKFSDAPPATIAAALLSVFAGLFLDEVGLFAFVLLPIMFWRLFWDPGAHPIGRKPDWSGIALCAIPGVAFLALVVVVIPSFYEQLFHRPFDYLGNVFAVGVGSLGAESVFVGPHGTFGWEILWEDFANLFGISLVPVQMSPFTTDNPQDIGLVQVGNVPKLVGIAAFFGPVAICAARRSKAAQWLRRVMITTVVFVVLMTLLSIRHNPLIIGYYYGASFSLFIALLVGLAVAAAGRMGPAWRLAGVLAAGLIVFVQINNFMFVNDRWRVLHYQYAVRSIAAREFNLSDNEVSRGELFAIRSAWKENKLEPYLSGHAISVGAVYLAYELRAIDRLSPRPAK